MNNPIKVVDLPQLSDHEFVGVSPKYLTMMTLPYYVLMAVVAVVAIVAALIVSPWLLLIGFGVVVLFGLVVLLRRLAVPHLGYQAREHDFSIRYGLIIRSATTIPFKRIQNSVVSQGPLQRRYGLASLTISSARGAIGIPGLPLEDANELRAFVAERAAIEIEDDDGA